MKQISWKRVLQHRTRSAITMYGANGAIFLSLSLMTSSFNGEGNALPAKKALARRNGILKNMVQESASEEEQRGRCFIKL
jgi:hypothetical protein